MYIYKLRKHVICFLVFTLCVGFDWCGGAGEGGGIKDKDDMTP